MAMPEIKPQPRWTPEREARLREFWPQRSLPLKIIAQEMGVSVSAISIQARALELPSRYDIRRKALDTARVLANCHLNSNDYNYLEQAANLRNMPVRNLIKAMIKAIARDKMCNAILDDMPVAAE
jgi:hypothetical protein